MNVHSQYALQVLPPALNREQWMAYTGCGRTAFFEFAKKHRDYAVAIDGNGNQRIKREWADAFIMGRMEDMAFNAGVILRK